MQGRSLEQESGSPQSCLQHWVKVTEDREERWSQEQMLVSHLQQKVKMVELERRRSGYERRAGAVFFFLLRTLGLYRIWLTVTGQRLMRPTVDQHRTYRAYGCQIDSYSNYWEGRYGYQEGGVISWSWVIIRRLDSNPRRLPTSAGAAGGGGGGLGRRCRCGLGRCGLLVEKPGLQRHGENHLKPSSKRRGFGD